MRNEERYKFFKGDICDESLVKKILSEFEVDAIVNFAAESHVDRSITGLSEFISTNVLGTFNLLKCAQEHHKKLKNFCFLHVSTDEVYGSLELDEPSLGKIINMRQIAHILQAKLPPITW